MNAYNVLVSNVSPVKAVTSGIMESTEVNVANQAVSSEPEYSTDISPQTVINNDKESFLTEQINNRRVTRKCPSTGSIW